MSKISRRDALGLLGVIGAGAIVAPAALARPDAEGPTDPVALEQAEGGADLAMISDLLERVYLPQMRRCLGDASNVFPLPGRPIQIWDDRPIGGIGDG